MAIGLTLLVKETPGDQVDRYQYRPRRYPWAISGAVTDGLAPLPLGTSYTTVADVSDFRNLVTPKAAELSLEWQIQAPHAAVGNAVLLANFWTGTLRSNDVRFPDQCKPLRP